MTIHSEHPFLEPEGERDPLRRLRGRTPSPVMLWATGDEGERAGLTISSVLVADGDPGRLLALVDEDSTLWEALEERPAGERTVAASLLAWPHRTVADAFAGLTPAPGGAFRVGSWQQTDWGPVLTDAPVWVGARLVEEAPRHAGWALLVEAVIEHIELVSDEPAMTHVRGRYREH